MQGNKRIIICITIVMSFLFLLTLNYADNIDFNYFVTPLSTDYSQIDYTVSCQIGTKYMGGDLINYQVYLCQQENCNLIDQKTIVFQKDCKNYYSVTVKTIPSQLIWLAFYGKRYEDSKYTAIKIEQIGQKIRGTSEPIQNALLTTKTKDPLFLYIGIIILATGLICLMFKFWWALLPIIIGLVITIVSILA